MRKSERFIPIPLEYVRHPQSISCSQSMFEGNFADSHMFVRTEERWKDPELVVEQDRVDSPLLRSLQAIPEQVTGSLVPFTSLVHFYEIAAIEPREVCRRYECSRDG